MNAIPGLSLPHSHRRLIVTGIHILLVSLILCPMSGRAQGYLPLDVGNEWYYESDLAETQLMTIIGEDVILGTVTRVRRQEMEEDLFENFWTSDSLGHIYLHGARNLIDSFEVAYLPPIRMVDAPLGFGKAWVTEGVRGYDLDGTAWGGDPQDYRLRVYSEGFVRVPAGEFYSYGVGFEMGVLLVKSASGEFYDLFGRHTPIGEEIGEADIVAWYCDRIGLVQHTIYPAGQHALELHWWTTPVSVESCSWGRLKQLFR